MDKLRLLVDRYQMQQHFIQERFHVPMYELQRLEQRIRKTVESGGYYYMTHLSSGEGYAWLFFSNEDGFKSQIEIRRPKADPATKIPKLEWLKEFLRPLRELDVTDEAKELLTKITKHIRDGGEWEPYVGNGYNQVRLSFKGELKTTLTYHQEVNAL
ncbi:hypothetical protein AVT69_gp026 [Pseudomonas phage PhiPA3]|uniref:Uncharacterized protein 025 n=1 Tax=Pseudomonas phage PhiPA3 TaxID=998086 RepID=F8SJQ7_BPPA3|nr:hypothetical protein AVT69_gp026 [Pseudomonas phage PhiPA3]AEH03452.1 hypothetical protein [Pseudomonas phage PhiPA3]